MVSEIFSMSPFWGFPTGVTTKPSGVIQGASSSSSGQVALSKSLAWCWVTAGKRWELPRVKMRNPKLKGMMGLMGMPADYCLKRMYPKLIVFYSIETETKQKPLHGSVINTHFFPSLSLRQSRFTSCHQLEPLRLQQVLVRGPIWHAETGQRLDLISQRQKGPFRLLLVLSLEIANNYEINRCPYPFTPNRLHLWHVALQTSRCLQPFLCWTSYPGSQLKVAV